MPALLCAARPGFSEGEVLSRCPRRGGLPRRSRGGDLDEAVGFDEASECITAEGAKAGKEGRSGAEACEGGLACAQWAEEAQHPFRKLRERRSRLEFASLEIQFCWAVRFPTDAHTDTDTGTDAHNDPVSA